MSPESKPSPDFVSLEDRAIVLRRSALQTRFRLAEQRAALEKIAASLARAKESALMRPSAAPVAAPAPAPAPAPGPATLSVVPAREPHPVTLGTLRTVPTAPLPSPAPRKEAARQAPAPAGPRPRYATAFLHALLPFLAIGAAALVAQAKIAPKLAVLTPPAPGDAAPSRPGRDALLLVEPPDPSEDDGSAEALLLVHDWKPAGSDLTLLEQLGGELDRPGLPPSWTVERTGPRNFLVRFRDGGSDHAFEADLETRTVRPAGENAALFAGR